MLDSGPFNARSVPDVRRRYAASVFGDALGGPEVGKIGLEPEFLVLYVDAAGRPTGRPRLEGEGGVLASLQPEVEAGHVALSVPGPPPVYALPNGGRLTFEPGAQVEHSTATHATGAAAMEDVEQVSALLTNALGRVGAVLAPVGLDVWTDRSLVPQQLRAARYEAMASYLDARSELGRVMMRHTGSFQVNLDLGARAVATERWRLANLLSPVATASFACSPAAGALSHRAQTWQTLDPTRTGFPKGLLEGRTDDPGELYADFALDADVLLFHQADGGAAPGEPGFTMRRWIEEGHPRHGSPAERDLDYHLTTLFPEVRLRGFLEIRSCDALPARWSGVNVVFWAGLLYDPSARRAALELLEPSLPELERAWRDAAEKGLASAHVREVAAPLWRLALEGAGRLGDDWVRPVDLGAAEDYIERFVLPGHPPAERLAELLAEDPARALAWARGV